jgi:MoaA/NifB/PqqE/SkfB family radical SAM enzyme
MSEMQAITPFNPMKLLRHIDVVDASLRGEWVAPVSVEIDATNFCGHGCRFCSFGTEESQGYRQTNMVEFPTARMLSLLEELADAGVKSVTFTGGGEPLIHRHISAILEKATSVGLEWGVVTNGASLIGRSARAIADHATFCRVSLDSGSSETHQITHRVKKPQFAQILDNMRHVRSLALGRAIANPITLGASFCVMRSNWKEIYAAALAVKEHGGDYLEVRPTYPTDWRGDGWNEDLTREEVESAKVELLHTQTHLNDGTFSVIGMVDRFDALHGYQKLYTKCRSGAVSTVIGADGRIWQCCVQRGMDGFEAGNVMNRPFRDVWQDVQHKAMVDGINVNKCPRCRYDGFNRLIENAVMKDGMHANFL